jgi:methyltransferase (TIGR00027 family)
MTSIELPAGVGWTALLTAYGRAQESRQIERLFSDPLAAAFVEAVKSQGERRDGKLPRLGPAVDDDSSSLWNAFRFYFTQRIPFYDQQILTAVGAGCQQVVLLGAGLDSRAFRLGLPESVTVFELDQSSVLDFKQTVLTRHSSVPTCRRVPLVADLLADWPAVLPAAGFDAALPTAWVAEGLLMYLSRADADRLLDRITALSAPGSRIITEYFSKVWQDSDVVNETFDSQDRAAWDLVRGSFLYGPVADHPAAWLSGHGWAPGVITTVAELGRQSGRTVPPEFGRPGSTQVWLLEGTYAASPQ